MVQTATGKEKGNYSFKERNEVNFNDMFDLVVRIKTKKEKSLGIKKVLEPPK